MGHIENRLKPKSNQAHKTFSSLCHVCLCFFSLSSRADSVLYLAATAAESVAAHRVVRKCALLTAGSSAASALLQTQT